ncbi:PepSY-like domain-containing protein [Fulvivirgaceae bacterium BMA10]|uniref:PepSY-like domain-containing protein n=1 Tax=Splendidivirga corallicola TaxID=3051826 RepID=A0ABT8KVN2_9BACT|nr:PepSY-like domain-containing protein [Fulvivirgaceae bacterium BMA10]
MRSMRWWILIFIIFQISGCDQSYDLDASIEVSKQPGENTENLDLETFVDKSLKEMYPKIGQYKLKIEDDQCEANFKIGGNDFNVKFGKGGIWKRSEVGIRYENKIPKKIRKAIQSSDLDDWFLVDKTLIETASEKRYKIEFQRGEEEWDIYFSDTGEILQREKQIKKTKNL